MLPNVMHGDPLEELLEAREQGGWPSLPWVVRWSQGGHDPVVAAWCASECPEALFALALWMRHDEAAGRVLERAEQWLPAPGGLMGVRARQQAVRRSREAALELRSGRRGTACAILSSIVRDWPIARRAACDALRREIPPPPPLAAFGAKLG